MSVTQAARATGSLRALIVGLTVGAVAGLGATAAVIPHFHRPDAVALLLYASLVVAAELAVVSVRFGSNVLSLGWGEAALILGLTVLPAPWVVLCAAGAATATHLARRKSPSKVLLNAAASTLGAALAALTGSALAGTVHSGAPLELATPRAVLAAVAAAVIFSVVTNLAVSTAIAFSQGESVGALVLAGVGQQVIVVSGNISAALVIDAVRRWDAHVLIGIPPILYALHAAYRHRLAAQSERTTWEQLAIATGTLVRVDEHEVARSAISSAMELFRADAVEVLAVRTDGTLTALGEAAGGRDRRHGDPRPALPDWGMVLSTDLDDGISVTGELRLCFHSPVRLTDRERATLNTFAAALSAGLNNARLHDITRELADLKAYEATHDSLTGLCNRALLFERGEEVLAAVARGEQVVALLLLDLDHFKEINDTLGHQAGDQLLQAVAARLGASIRRGDTAARLGGDEFALLLTRVRDPDSAVAVATDLLKSFNAPVVVEGLRLPVEGSIGVACAPTDATTMTELLRCADVAMYQAKGSGAAVERYDAGRDGGTVDRLLLIDELRDALSCDQLLLHFQPKVDLRSGRFMGAEALVRWQHPRRGLLWPAEFMSIVEHSGLVRQFTLRVLRLALAECAEWGKRGAPLPVAVNLSTRNLLDPEMPGDVASLLVEYRLPSDRLVLEITETVAMSELDVVEKVLEELRTLGAELSVDDFGTGYSSLTFLSRVTVHEVKVDGSFVSTMLDVPGNAAIVRATIELAHSFGLRVIAEGVESPQHYQALQAMGCDGAQGYYPGIAVAASEIRQVFARQSWQRPGAPPSRPAAAPVVLT